MLHILALWYFDTSVTYSQWFRTLKFVLILPRFIQQQYLWNIVIQPAVGCFNSWADIQCQFGLRTARGNIVVKWDYCHAESIWNAHWFWRIVDMYLQVLSYFHNQMALIHTKPNFSESLKFCCVLLPVYCCAKKSVYQITKTSYIYTTYWLYKDCWKTGYAQSQGIGSHCIDPVSQ